MRTRSLGAPGGGEAGEEGVVELEIDHCEVVDVLVGDPVDAPDARSDKGGFRG